MAGGWCSSRTQDADTIIEHKIQCIDILVRTRRLGGGDHIDIMLELTPCMHFVGSNVDGLMHAAAQRGGCCCEPELQDE